MIARALARLLAFLHVAYVVFVVTGSLFALRWPWMLWVHIAAIVWAFATMTTDLGCVLTTWEKTLWRRGGIEPYPEGFLQHHVFRTKFSKEHEKRNHVSLGVLALVFNVVAYYFVWRQRGAGL